MSETGADAAQRYREHMRAKAERLGGGEDARSVDASDFTPAEKLYAGVKTGMRPVSRQARASGGAVSGAHAAATPGRAGRKAGGGLGESYVNRDQKAANADREGEYPNGGMRKGGRARRAEGGYLPREGGPTATRALKRKTGSSEVETNGRPAAEDGRQGRAAGGRAARQAGGPLATPLAAGMGGQGRMNFNFGPQSSTGAKLGIKTGGRVRADGGRAKAHERYGHGPSCSCPECRGGRVGRAYGGDVYGRSPENRQFDEDAAETLGQPRNAADDWRDDRRPPAPSKPRRKKANGGAAPGAAENDATPGSVKTPIAAKAKTEDVGAVGQPSLKHRAPHGENSSRDKTLTAAGASVGRAIDTMQGRYRKLLRKDGGEVAKGALKQHRLEHEALETKTRARGGKAGKGKTNINIVIGTPGGMSQGAGPMGPNPQLAIKPPAPPMPLPMPPPGGAPAPGAPMPMPIPMAGPAGPPGPPGMPPGMPPRARGGRAPKVRGEPEAGAGSGLGRLQKAAEYGHRSREGEDLRK